MNPEPGRLRADIRLWAILGLALLVRLLALRTGTVLADLQLVGDEGNYVFNAAAMLDGTLAAQDLALPWMRAPLLPLAIAGLSRLTGTSPLVTIVPIALLHILLSVAMAAMAAGIAERLAGRRAALLAAAVMATLPAWIFYPQLVLSETLYSFFLLWSLWLLARQEPGQRLRPGFWLALGGVLGLAALSRSAVISALPLYWLAGWLLLGRWRPAAAAALLTAGALALVVAPWTYRNYVEHNTVVLVDTTGPYTLWQDNTPLDRPEVKAKVMSLPTVAERQAFVSAAFRQELARDPGRFAANAAARLLRAPLPDPTHIYRDDWLRTYPDGNPLWAELYGLGSALSYALLAPLALLGGLALWRGRRWGSPQRIFALLAAGLFAHYLVQTMTTHFSQRFLVPLFPAFAALAASALAAWRPALRLAGATWPGRLALALIALFLVGGARYNAPALAMARADWLWWRGADCAGAGDLAALRDAAAGAPKNTWRLTTAIGRCELKLGQPGAAVATLELASLQAQAQEQPGADARAALIAAHRAAGDLAAAQDAHAIATTGRLALLDWAWRDTPPPAAEIIAGTLDAGYLRGFYGAETGEGRSFRWMGPVGALRFPGCAPGPHLLRLELASGRPDGSPGELVVNGAPPVAVPAGWRALDLLTTLGPDCAVTLRAGTWSPLALNPASRDPRALGFVLSRASIVPAGR